MAKKASTKKSASKKAAKKKSAPKKAAKKAAKKAPAKAAAKKTGAKKKRAGGGGLGLMKPVQPSAELAAIVGAQPLPRTEVISKLWDHIRRNKLQNPGNKREILADDKLQPIFGKDRVSMFEMNKLISGHLK